MTLYVRRLPTVPNFGSSRVAEKRARKDQLEAMRDSRGSQLLNLFRGHKIKTIEERQSLRGFHKRYRSARTGAQLHPGGGPCGADQIDHIALEFLADSHLLHRSL